jgi:hypothetical protein
MNGNMQKENMPHHTLHNTITSNSTPERTKTNRQTEHNKNAGSQAKEHPSCQ